MRMNEDGSMSDHLVEASELVHRLTRMGEPLKEHLVVAIMLSSLPESYGPLVTALEGRPEEDLTLDYVKGKLLDEWKRKCEVRKQEEEKALKSTIQCEDRVNRVWTCYYCGQVGHLKRNCAAWLEEIRRNKMTKKNRWHCSIRIREAVAVVMECVSRRRVENISQVMKSGSSTPVVRNT